MDITPIDLPNIGPVPGSGTVAGRALVLVNIDNKDYRLPVDRLPTGGSYVRIPETTFLALYADQALGSYNNIALAGKSLMITDRAAGDGDVYLPYVMSNGGVSTEEAYLLTDTDSPAIPISYNPNDGTTGPRGGAIDESNLVHRTGDEYIAGLKRFLEALTVQLGSLYITLDTDGVSVIDIGTGQAAYLKNDRLLLGDNALLGTSDGLDASGQDLQVQLTPTTKGSATSKQYVDGTVGAAVFGIAYKDEVQLRVVALPGGTTLATVGLPTIQGYAIQEGDRIMYSPGTAESGIYDAHASGWTRSADCNTTARARRATAWVLRGDYAVDGLGNQLSYTATLTTGTLGTTAFNFQVNYNAVYTNGSGLDLAGGTFSTTKASDAETQAGTDAVKAITSLRLANWWTYVKGQPQTFANLTATSFKIGGTGATATLSRDSYAIADNTTVTGYIVGGTYANGELQSSSANYAAAIAASAAGDEFTTSTYGYRYQRKADGTLGWCRYPKG